ncbi:carboxypeptidase-like regulatory domain-containing protein [Hymenobacter sp. BT635]|uniref:Carboxypeptidase-like regulatory domain-containing protein n=1 Tax=Hymenobacter nitidus TaxID=2880929 RepID=A0ABS8AJ49_9BACT|nr:carboxypeptidase-like regulatory domain-containing protein [Hymenobacter nitidus]MCB2380463.1 carboxypeptidase-like regulatory domain-containing protein [Hymenobacter nitidus]
MNHNICSSDPTKSLSLRYCLRQYYMAISFRIHLLALCISTVSFTACSDSTKESPAPVSSVTSQDAVGTFSPATALTKITATPVGGGTEYVATMTVTGTYRFQSLPLGKYELKFVPVAGYAAPPSQVLTVEASSAPKTQDVTVLTERTALLTGIRWKVTSNISLNVTTGTSLDFLAADPACARDNFLRFNADNTLSVDEGVVKCSASGPQVFSYGWALEKNETQLRYSYTDRPSTLLEIVELTATSVHLRDVSTSGGYTYVHTITYAPF